RSLPRRNYAAITSSTGLLGLIERLFRLDFARDRRNPVRRMVIMCKSEADARAGLADAEIYFRDKTKKNTKIGPNLPPYTLGLGYYLAKGPRRADGFDSGLDLADTFGTTVDRR